MLRMYRHGEVTGEMGVGGEEIGVGGGGIGGCGGRVGGAAGEGVEGGGGGVVGDDRSSVVVGEVEEFLHDEMVGRGVVGGELLAEAALEELARFHGHHLLQLLCCVGLRVWKLKEAKRC